MDELTCKCGCGEAIERGPGHDKRRLFVDRRHAGRYNARQFRDRHPDAGSAAVRGDYQRSYQLRRFGLTPESYAALLASQGGGCAICGTAPGKRQLAVDHDHRCCPRLRACDKCRRGLLCTRCNTILGHLDDDPDFLRKIENYLDRK